MKLSDIEQLVCLHYLPASEREPIIKDTINRLGIDFVEIYESVPFPHFDKIANFHRLNILKNVDNSDTYYDKVGVFNCSFSWYSIIKKLQYKKKKDSIYLLIEDDISIKDKDLLVKMLDELPDDFDIARLNVTREYPIGNVKDFDLPINKYWNKQLDHNFYVNCYWGCTGFMIMKSAGIDFFCNFIEKNGYCPADHPFMNTVGLNHYIISPEYNNKAVVEGSFSGNVSSLIQGDSVKREIYIHNLFGQLANQLFPIFCSLSLYDKNKNKFNKPTLVISERTKYHHPEIIEDVIKPYFSNVINFLEEDKGKEVWRKVINSQTIRNGDVWKDIDSDVTFRSYCQDMELIDESSVRKYIKIPEKIKNTINDLYGDISNYICLHVRRGDFLSSIHIDTYVVLTKDYIERVISKYFPNEKIICISDDLCWCKDNLRDNPNIIFADKSRDSLVDFFIQTMTKGNICSGSTFSIAGTILNPNPNKVCIVPDPFFKNPIPKIDLIPRYAIREKLV